MQLKYASGTEIGKKAQQLKDAVHGKPATERLRQYESFGAILHEPDVNRPVTDQVIWVVEAVDDETEYRPGYIAVNDANAWRVRNTMRNAAHQVFVERLGAKPFDNED